MLLKRKLTLLAVLLLAFQLYTQAQVTFGNLSGTIRSEKNGTLVGATIVLTHVPTGSVFTVTSKAGGHFDVPNIPPGGPYSILVTHVGFGEFRKTDINVPLGEKVDIDVLLSSDTQTLSGVTVTGTKQATAKSGASTSISNRQIQNMPNIARSLTNLTRLTPQSNGNSFAGMNNRFNNITIDGSLFNNNFGRSGDGMVPGGATSAISVDAIDQVQVTMAPYDVRQSGFVGGGINAVTRRGTNNLYVTAYGYYRNQNFNGTKVKGTTVPNSDRSNKTYGASIGAPIIKNKLFIFANYEGEKRSTPFTAVAKTSATDNNPNASGVLASDLDKLRSHLISNYQYDPGAYQGYNFNTDNNKFLVRLDWNINSMHRLTARYTQSETNDDDQINASSTSGIDAGRINNSRRAVATSGGMAYDGSNFKNNVKVKSAVLELNSAVSGKISNQLITSFTDNQLKRVPNSTASFVDIMKDASNVYISFGTDLFSYRNEISDKAFNVADNITINLGKHVFTGGANYDYMKFANSFMSAGGPSYYRFASLQDFLDNKAPTVFAVTYDPNNPKGVKVPETQFAQLGVYAQDAWSPVNNFKLTYGLRIDKPFYPYKAPQNPALAAVEFKDPDGNAEHFDVSKWPDAKILFSPRVGFNYDIKGDKSIVLRGGAGIFTGRIPFIWLVNQVGDNGVVRAQRQITGAALANVRYSTNRETYLPEQATPVTGTTSTQSYSAAAKDFKMPQTFRANLALDKRLAENYSFTFEALYSKMINNVYFRNANLGAQTGNLGGVVDKRPIYATKYSSSVNQMIVMDNASSGYSLSLTAGLQKSFSKNWEAGIAYTYMLAKDIAIGSSDQSASGFNTNNIIMNPNRPELGFSNFSIPHRIVANASYRFEYMQKKMATTIGMFYTAQPQERYTYRYSFDVNGDGQSNDMIYIPKDASEIQFVEGLKVGNNTYTAQQQSDAFFKFIENDKYLRKHKGQYMDRYGALLPWYHNVDLRILQDFSVFSGGKKHTIQVSLDVINFLNLLNSNWGYRYSYRYGSFQDAGILGNPTSSNNTGGETFNRANPKFTFDPNSPAAAYQANFSTTSTWGLQLGLRYIFN